MTTSAVWDVALWDNTFWDTDVIEPALLVNASTFFSPAAFATDTVGPAILNDPEIFYPAIIGLTLTPPLITDADQFFAPTVEYLPGAGSGQGGTIRRVKLGVDRKRKRKTVPEPAEITSATPTLSEPAAPAIIEIVQDPIESDGFAELSAIAAALNQLEAAVAAQIAADQAEEDDIIALLLAA